MLLHSLAKIMDRALPALFIVCMSRNPSLRRLMPSGSPGCCLLPAPRDYNRDRISAKTQTMTKLAASTMEARVEQVLTELLRQGRSVDYASVRAIASPEQSTVPQVVIPQPDLHIYDGLLVQGGAR